MDSLLFHPKVVHIPIALSVLMPLVAGGVLLAWWQDWLSARSWVLAVSLQAVLLGSAAVALQTGEAEEERVEQVVSEQAIEAHEEAAEVFVWGSGAVLGLMLLALLFSRSRAGLPLAATSVLGALLVLGLGYWTGQAGGELVYRHGAAKAYVGIGGQAPPSAALRAAHGDDEEDD